MKNTRCKIHRRVVSLLLALAIIFGGMNIPKSVNAAWGGPYWYKSQNDYTTSFNVGNDTRTVSRSGCAQTCVSMAIYKLLGYNISPEYLFADSIDKGYFTTAAGTDHSPIVSLCNNYGLACTWKSANDKSTIIQALKDGKMVIFNVGPDSTYHFAPDGSGGHYVILSGYDTKTNMIGVYDPYTNTDRNHKRRIGTMESWDTIKSCQHSGYTNNFAIVSKSSVPDAAINLSNVSLDTTNINKGSACNIRGVITAKRAIKSVKAEVVGTSFKATANTYGSKFDIKDTNANKSLSFGKIGAGNYTLRITVTDVYDKSSSKEIKFSIKGKEPTKGSIDFVKRLYNQGLKRTPDDGGLNYWAMALTNGEIGARNVVLSIFESDEFKNQKVNNEEFVKRAYMALLNRKADDDPTGKKFWMDQLKTKSRKQVLLGIMDSTEFANICSGFGIKQ